MAAKHYRPDDEPIPGYRLVDFLGRGGFGEVWKASGPGRIEVALKIIDSLAAGQGGKELRALRLLRKIRHPNLVPLLGYWLKSSAGQILPHEQLEGDTGPAPPTATSAPRVIATQLIVAMGLGERSLFDRLEQCRDEGLPGIPIAELLRCHDHIRRTAGRTAERRPSCGH